MFQIKVADVSIAGVHEARATPARRNPSRDASHRTPCSPSKLMERQRHFHLGGPKRRGVDVQHSPEVALCF